MAVIAGTSAVTVDVLVVVAIINGAATLLSAALAKHHRRASIELRATNGELSRLVHAALVELAARDSRPPAALVAPDSPLARRPSAP